MKIKAFFRYLITVGILFLTALGLEILIFNFRAVQSVFFTEVSYPAEEFELESFDGYDDGVYKLKADQGVLYLTGLQERLGGKALHNVYLDVSLPDAIDLPVMETGVLRIQPYMRDGGHDAYVRLAEHKLLDRVPVSKYLWVSGAGPVRTLALHLSFTNGKLLQIHRIVLNAHQPVRISPVRFLLLFLFCTALYALRRHSLLWKEESEIPELLRLLLPTALGLLLVVPAAYLIFRNDYLTAQVQFQPYQTLAEALAQGQVYLPDEVPQWLQEMENPYDDTLRTYLEEQSGEAYLWDYAYFKGHYYVYFGIIPCILFYLPYYLLTGSHMPNTLPILLAAAVTYAGIWLLLRKLAGKLGGVPYALQLILSAAVWLGCQIPFFLNQPDAYAVPVIVGEMFTVWGLYSWICSKEAAGKKKLILLAEGSLFMALVAGCRPNMVLYSFLAFVIFADEFRALFRKDTGSRKAKFLWTVCFMLPYLAEAVELMVYNTLRFGNPFDFGFAYNLTTQDTSRMVWSPDKLWVGIGEYLFRLPDLSYTFPFLSIPGDGTGKDLLGHTVFQMEYIFGGLLPCNLILLFTPVLFARPHYAEEQSETELKRFGALSLVLAGLMMLLDIQLAGVVYRYMADFSLMALLAASLAVILCRRHLAGTEAQKHFDRAAGILLAASFLFHVNFYWLSGLKYPLIWGNTELYYRIFYAFMFW